MISSRLLFGSAASAQTVEADILDNIEMVTIVDAGEVGFDLTPAEQIRAMELISLQGLYPKVVEGTELETKRLRYSARKAYLKAQISWNSSVKTCLRDANSEIDASTCRNDANEILFHNLNGDDVTQSIIESYLEPIRAEIQGCVERQDLKCANTLSDQAAADGFTLVKGGVPETLTPPPEDEVELTDSLLSELAELEQRYNATVPVSVYFGFTSGGSSCYADYDDECEKRIYLTLEDPYQVCRIISYETDERGDNNWASAVVGRGVSEDSQLPREQRRSREILIYLNAVGAGNTFDQQSVNAKVKRVRFTLLRFEDLDAREEMNCDKVYIPPAQSSSRPSRERARRSTTGLWYVHFWPDYSPISKFPTAGPYDTQIQCSKALNEIARQHPTSSYICQKST